MVFFLGRLTLYSTSKDSHLIQSCLINESTKSIERSSLQMTITMRTHLKKKKDKGYILVIAKSSQIGEIKQKNPKNLCGIIVESDSDAYRSLRNYIHKPVWAIANKEYTGILKIADAKGFITISEGIDDGECFYGFEMTVSFICLEISTYFNPYWSD